VPQLLFGLLLAGLVIVQARVLPEITLVQVRPNLLLVTLVLWTIARGPREGALWAFATGLFLDLVTLMPLGTHAPALLAAVAAGALARGQPFRLGVLVPMLAVLGATVVHDAVLLLVERATADLPATLVRLSLLAGILNLILTPLLAVLTGRLDGWLRRLEETLGRPEPPRPARRRS
jgi:rod shape-determining protein MreD